MSDRYYRPDMAARIEELEEKLQEANDAADYLAGRCEKLEALLEENGIEETEQK